MLSTIWNAQPLHTTLVELLQKKRGATLDIDLYNDLKKNDKDLSFKHFNKTLMKLEIEGIIHVASLTKNKRHVQLIKN
jgi:Fe2+ or Zn2+ uptake regulation protein